MAVTASEKRGEAEAANALDRLLDATRSRMEDVNRLILERADSHVDMVPELARYLIEAGGKRLRPMLTVAAAEHFGGGSGQDVKFAAAVEFMHNATLLHDDVVDESDMRRGRPAARIVWGNQASVLVGDYLLGQAFLMMVETGNLAALDVLSRTAAVIAEGEVFQLVKARDLDTTPDEYEQVIRAKTAALFEAACRVGAMAGGASEADQTALSEYGLALGLAFQLVDDVLDYGGASGTLGKNVGDDLREGKMTLPIILALQKASAEERALLAGALGDAKTGPETVAEIVAMLERHGSLKATLGKAQAYAEQAREALDGLPPSEMRDLLQDVAIFCVERAF